MASSMSAACSFIAMLTLLLACLTATKPYDSIIYSLSLTRSWVGGCRLRQLHTYFIYFVRSASSTLRTSPFLNSSLIATSMICS